MPNGAKWGIRFAIGEVARRNVLPAVLNKAFRGEL
jgi:hypothetical protein